jgi:hypothetical protein
MSKRVLQLCFAASWMAGVVWAGGDPFVGSWKLDASKSKATDEMRVASLGGNKYDFDLGGGVSEKIVVDGTDQAGIAGTTLSVEAEKAGVWKVVRKRDGKTLLVGIWTLSEGGNVLTDDYTSFDSSGEAHNMKYHYERAAGGPGFAATWVNDTEMNTTYVIDVDAYEGNGLLFTRNDGNGGMKLQFDGKDHPPINPNAAAGAASSASRVSERALEITDKLNRSTIATEHMEVSADLKTLTWTKQVVGRSQPSSTMVFERQ